MYFHLDGSEELEVNNGKESEGDEGHPQEVGDEDVVPRVRQVRSQAGGTEPGKHQIEIYWLQKKSLAPGYRDRCGIHTAVDAHQGHVHYLHGSGISVYFGEEKEI